MWLTLSAGIFDLSPLAGMTQLTYLNLEGALASDFTFLSGMHLMKKLDLSWALRVSSIAECANMEDLEWLSIRACNVSDMRPLSHLTKLTRIHIHLCRDEDGNKPDRALLPSNTHL